jgi:hypothetical protein
VVRIFTERVQQSRPPAERLEDHCLFTGITGATYSFSYLNQLLHFCQVLDDPVIRVDKLRP